MAAFNLADDSRVSAISVDMSATGTLSVEDIVLDGSSIYFSGNFTVVNSQSRSNIAAIDADGTLLAFAPNAAFFRFCTSLECLDPG